MHINTKHGLEKTAIELEQHADHFSSSGYPWYDRKASTAFRRAARILRKELEREE